MAAAKAALVVRHEAAGDECVRRTHPKVEYRRLLRRFAPLEHQRRTKTAAAQRHDAFTGPELAGVLETSLLRQQRVLLRGPQFPNLGFQDQQRRARRENRGDHRCHSAPVVIHPQHRVARVELFDRHVATRHAP